MRSPMSYNPPDVHTNDPKRCEDIILVHDLSKVYRIFPRPADRLKQMLWPRLATFSEFQALQGINFSVKRGEVVGIVGRNGSGKSTLLQIIAGTLSPSCGEVSVRGRVAALLELGSGFDPEFTGRENVFLNGMLLGATQSEVAERLPTIESFAEIGEYFDRPVKTYSSGMVVRLAFAVQAMLEKDILIVDEALAVGDELFQRKCFGAIERFRDAGGTVLFVSHSGETVLRLCDRALLLHRGELITEGSAKRVMDWYHKLIYSPPEAGQRLLMAMREMHLNDEVAGGDSAHGAAWPGQMSTETEAAQEVKNPLGETPDYDPNLQSRSALFYEDRGAYFSGFELRDSQNSRVNLLRGRQRYRWTYEVEFREAAHRVRFGVTIKTAAGLELGGATSAHAFQGLQDIEPGQRVQVGFSFAVNLAPGVYFLNAGIAGELNGQEHYLARAIDIGVFRVLDDEERIISGGPVDFLVDSWVSLVAAERLNGA